MDNLETVLVNCRGGLTYSATSYNLVFSDLNYESVSMSFDEDTVIGTESGSSIRVTLPDSFERPNAVRIKYLTSNAGPGRGQPHLCRP